MPWPSSRHLLLSNHVVGAKQYHQEPSQLCPRHRPQNCSAQNILTLSVTCSLKKTHGNVEPERGGCLLVSSSINLYFTLFILFPCARTDKIFSLLWRFPYMYCPYYVIQLRNTGNTCMEEGYKQVAAAQTRHKNVTLQTQRQWQPHVT